MRITKYEHACFVASVGEKKLIVPPELLEEVFELNMQLQEMRMAQQMGEDEPELRRDLMTAKDAFDARMATEFASAPSQPSKNPRDPPCAAF